MGVSVMQPIRGVSNVEVRYTSVTMWWLQEKIARQASENKLQRVSHTPARAPRRNHPLATVYCTESDKLLVWGM